MAKKKIRPTPKDPKPRYDPNAGTQVGEREYNPNSVTRYNADQFLKNQPTAGSMITPGFKEMGNFMNWLQQFVNVNRDEYNTNPFSELKPNPLMAQLRAGINPYPGTRGYIPPTSSSRGAPPPQGPMPSPIPGKMLPGNKIPPFTPPPPRLPSPSMPLPPKPGGGRVPLPMPGTRVPPSSGKFEGFVPLPYPGNPGIRNPQPYQPPQPPNAPRPSQSSPKPPIQSPMQPPKKPAPKPKQVKPTLNSFIPRYERD